MAPHPHASVDVNSTDVLKNLLIKQQWQSIAHHVRTNPADAKQLQEFNGVKALPLHVACAIGAPIGVIKSLIAAHSTALQTQNDSGRLPLHCLFLHHCPSLNVLSAIVEAYPAASRMADSNGKLPIHYACERKGVTDDIFTILLSTYPEGAYARDFSGNFPINYATSNEDGSTKKCALAALDRGTLFASISKMTSNRLMNDHEAKIRTLEESHVKKMNNMENRHKEEKFKLKSEIEGLKSQLKLAKEVNQTNMEELNAAETKKEEAVEIAVQNEQAKASDMEKNLRTDLAGVQLKNMDLIDQLESVQLDLDNSRVSEANRVSEIETLKHKLDDVSATLSTTQTSLESTVKLAQETQEKLSVSEQSNAEKSSYISHLEESLLKAQEAVMKLAEGQDEMKKAMEAQKEMLNNMMLAHNASSGNVGGLLVDMVSLADDIGAAIKSKE